MSHQLLLQQPPKFMSIKDELDNWRFIGNFRNKSASDAILLEQYTNTAMILGIQYKLVCPAVDSNGAHHADLTGVLIRNMDGTYIHNAQTYFTKVKELLNTMEKYND